MDNKQDRLDVCPHKKTFEKTTALSRHYSAIFSL